MDVLLSTKNLSGHQSVATLFSFREYHLFSFSLAIVGRLVGVPNKARLNDQRE